MGFINLCLQGIKINIQASYFFLSAGCSTGMGVPALWLTFPLRGQFHACGVNGNTHVNGLLSLYIVPGLFQVKKQTESFS
jgi:hypothetical protein